MKKQIAMMGLLCVTVFQLHAQTAKNGVVIPLVGAEAPSFTAETTKGTLNFPQDFGKNWKILFAHPKDFTPVCSSELLELAQQQDEYAGMGVKIAIISTDILNQHRDWVTALEQINYKDRAPVKINFPLIADPNYLVSNKYGLIHPAASVEANIRAVFIIDPNNKIRAINFYPIQIGRNMDEIQRTVIALQTIDKQSNLVTPANWKPGDHLMVPVLTQSEKDNIGKPGSTVHQVAWFMNFRK